MAELMTDEQLAGAQVLCERATPGPWEVIETDAYRTIVYDEGRDSVLQESTLFLTEGDADFIAASRSLIPALLSHIQAQADLLKATQDALRDYVEAYHREIHPGETLFQLSVSRKVREAARDALIPKTTAEIIQARDLDHA